MKFNFLDLLMRKPAKSQREFISVPSNMTPRRAVAIAHEDISEDLERSIRRANHLQRQLEEAENHRDGLVKAQDRMSLWLENNPE